MMSENVLKDQYKKLKSLLSVLNRIVSNNLNQEISDQTELLEAIHSNLKSIVRMKAGSVEETDKNQKIVSFHKQNLEVLYKNFISVSAEDSFLKKITSEFAIEIDRFLADAPDKMSIEYPLDSFKARKADPIGAKASFWFETRIIRIQKAGLRIGNFFRKLFKREPKHTESRMLNILFKKNVEGYFLPEYMTRISDTIKTAHIQLVESYTELLEFEHEIVQNDYLIPEETLSEFQIKNIDLSYSTPSGFLDEHKTELQLHFQRSGMLLSMNLWRNMGRSRDYKKSGESLVKQSKTWQTTFFAFFEDWRFHEQLCAYSHSVQSATQQVESIYSQRIKNSLLPEVEKQLDYTSTLKSRLPDPDTAKMETIRSFFVSELYKLKKVKLNEEQKNRILQTAEDIPKLLLKTGHELNGKLEIFPKRVGVVANPKYLSGIKASEIYYFSPGEFIEFECISSFRARMSLLSSKLADELHAIISDFFEFDQIIDFYLDSTIALTEKPGLSEKEVITFFRDGLERLLTISNKISEFLRMMQNEKLSEISEVVKEFLKEVAELDDNDNIINIYARLIKSKALAESRSKKRKLVDFSKSSFDKASAVVGGHTKLLRSFYFRLKKRLRLDKSAGSISSAISNYLTDIQYRIYDLPVIYQHLFENIPVREFNLFLSREEDISKLNAAYNYWLKENFAATLVTGENGSGKSSLLYYYSKTLKSQYQIVSFQISRFYSTEDDYFTLVGELFKTPGLHNDDSIAAYISSLKERRIVIIDGLERLFIRKVNGFACLQKLLSLIVSTNQHIFWVCSVSQYASTYLNKTISLSEYFDYTINIDSLTSKQIQDIVLKRNRLSGYQISYLSNNSTGEGAKAKKMSQRELEDKYFAELNQFAGSNISLSLNYWLQSVHSVQGDRIEIENFVAPDFGFLENLSPEKAYTLLVVVMHGKISLEQHALIFNQKKEKSFKVLTILKEDAILVKKGDFFILNGILFRHVVRVLKNRNLIH